MTFWPVLFRIIAAAGFFVAAAASLRNHFLTRKMSNLWLWLSIAMALIGASQFPIILSFGNVLWRGVTIALLLASSVIILVVLFDFEKEVNICINCGSSLSSLPRSEQKKKVEKRLRGF